MDLLIIVAGIFIFAPVLFGLLGAFFRLLDAYQPGRDTEELVSELLSMLSTGEYAILDDVMLKTKNGNSAQIDHIVVSIYGVFVIETKECSGWVFGNPKQRSWTICYPNGDRRRMYNPLLQNDGHIRHLKAAANIWKTPVYSVVVFGGEYCFKTDMPKNVVDAYDLIEHIESHRDEVLTPTQVQYLSARIERKSIQNTADNRQRHIDYVESVKNEP